jgi:serine/threonine-protein kinase HipA
MSQVPNVEVEVHLGFDEETVRVGTAYVSLRRGTVTTNFNYDPTYLRRGNAWEISPDLPIAGGSAVTNGLPGAMTDSAPDRWGRNLIKKRLRAQAYENRQKESIVTEVDYLLGVSDLTRQGTLR